MKRTEEKRLTELYRREHGRFSTEVLGKEVKTWVMS